MYYKLNEELINKKYKIKLCSIEKKYIYYRDNFKRVILENYYLQKRNHELIEDNDIQENFISKDIIRNKIKELEERNKMFKLELPEDVTIYQYGIEVLKELLGE